MNFLQKFQIPRPRKINLANAESILIKMNAIFRFFDKFWLIKMYHNIYLRKLFSEICSNLNGTKKKTNFLESKKMYPRKNNSTDQSVENALNRGIFRTQWKIDDEAFCESG